MPSRPVLTLGTLAATVALTATAGLSGGAAHAAHPAGAHVARPAVGEPLTVTVTSTKSSTAMSTVAFAPGNTVFDIHGKGALEIVSLKSGYTIRDFAKDGKKLFSGDVATVRRVDKKVVFWGGAQGSASGVQVGINLPAGSYYAVNLDRNNVVPFTVSGLAESRALPDATGTVKMVQEMTFHAPDTLPNQGWIRIDNKASEPHFVDFSRVKVGTSRAQVAKFLASGAQGHPSWALKESHEALIVSPGHSYVFDMDATKGEYVELCFWPSKRTGMPHALMGMFDISQLH